MGVIKFRLVKFDKTLLFQIIEQSDKVNGGIGTFGVVCRDADGNNFLVACASTIQFKPLPTTTSINNIKYSIYLRGAGDIHKPNKICITTYNSNELRDYWYDRLINGLKLGAVEIDNWSMIYPL